MSTPCLTDRELNRALLGRQLLLDRVGLSPVDAVEHLVGMQAQSPTAPYLGLWTRLRGFAITDLADAILDRTLVRSSLMRGTIHLVSARDCRTLHPLTKPVFARAVGTELPDDERAEVLARAESILAELPRSLAELRELIGEPAARLARYLLPLIHVPPRGIWGRSGQARLTTVRTWLGADVEPEPKPAEVVTRYLAAYGPASVKDMQTWSGLTGLRPAFESLDLRTYRDESGTPLYDVPDGTLPDADTPAPVRFLPEYDNALRSHTVRRRIMTDETRALLFSTKNDAPMPAFLVDGFVSGTWKLATARKSATLTIRPYSRLSPRDTAAVLAEARRLLDFAAADIDAREVELA
jgi:winged helix DNA-binding protein